MIFWLRVSRWYLCVRDQIVVRRLIPRSVLAVRGQVDGDAQVRQDVQRAQPGFVRVLPDGVGPPPAPPRALAVDVDQLVVVVEDVVR